MHAAIDCTSVPMSELLFLIDEQSWQGINNTKFNLSVLTHNHLLLEPIKNLCQSM